MRLILPTMLLWTANALGATFNVEDDSLVKVPDAVSSGIAAYEKSSMPTNYKGQPCGFIGKAMAIQEGGAAVDWVVTTSDACSWAASAAPVWVLVQSLNGQYQVVLFHVTYDLTIGKTSLNGLRHIATARATVARQEEQLWKYDGTKYQLAKMKVQ